jgi:tetratricopeptide (TPR) repeat protein
MCLGWPREGRGEAEISYRLNPAKSTVYRLRANTFYAERDYTNAIKWYQQTLDVEPHHRVALRAIGQALRALGDYPSAITNFEAADLLTQSDKSEVRQRYQALRQAYAERGLRGYWEEERKRSEQSPADAPYEKAVIQMHLGNTNAALDLLEKSYGPPPERHGLTTILADCLLFDECWDELYDLPRFKALLEKIGFTKVMPSRKVSAP